MRLLTALFLLAAPLPALAIYKCENAGKVSYSDMPCTGNRTSTITTDHNTIGPGPAGDDARLERQKDELARMQRARHQREAREETAARKAAKAYAAHEKKCAALAQRKKWREEDAAMATGKKVARARLLARRMGEKYQLECGDLASRG